VHARQGLPVRGALADPDEFSQSGGWCHRHSGHFLLEEPDASEPYFSGRFGDLLGTWILLVPKRLTATKDGAAITA
jgi:hypothetical protein